MQKPDKKTAKDVLRTILDAKHEAMLAGGCVRDGLLGLQPKDYDVATAATPDEVLNIFSKTEWKTVPTGLDHGTITIVAKGQPIEVTTLRKDVSTDGRRATVAFTTSFEEDAARRDFTINAMFEDYDGKVFDYFGGQDHLKKKVLSFVGAPTERVREDYLRILRLYRFWARLKFKPDNKSLQAAIAEQEGLGAVSQERITAELWETLSYENIDSVIESLVVSGILARLLCAEIPTDSGLGVPGYDHLPAPSRPAARLATFLGSLSTPEISQQLQKMKLSAEQQKQVAGLILACAKIAQIDQKASQADLLLCVESCEHLSGLGFLDTVLPYYHLRKSKTNTALIEKVAHTKGHLLKNKLPINGHELATHLQMEPGKALGAILLELRRGYLDEKWKTRDEGLKFAEKNKTS